MCKSRFVAASALLLLGAACSSKSTADGKGTGRVDAGGNAGAGGVATGGVGGVATGGTAGIGTGGVATGGSGAVGTGGSGGQVPDAGPPVTPVGQTGYAKNYSMVVETVKECVVPPYFEPAAGNIKLGVGVVIEATTTLEVSVNPFYAKVTDSNGTAYTSTFGGCTPDLKSVKLTQGQKATGWITFEVPKSAFGFVLSYNPIIIGGGKQELLFDLGL